MTERLLFLAYLMAYALVAGVVFLAIVVVVALVILAFDE